MKHDFPKEGLKRITLTVMEARALEVLLETTLLAFRGAPQVRGFYETILEQLKAPR